MPAIIATEFTPGLSLAGGALIGVAAVLFLLLRGRIAGISGIAGDLLPPYSGSRVADSAAVIAGLFAAPLLYVGLRGSTVDVAVAADFPQLAIAGLLVGFGAAYGRGCTSGHGVCGLSRLSVRSLVAVAIFMATAAITVYVLRHGALP